MVGNSITAGNQSIFVYTGGQFTPINATLTYLKEPRKMFYSGYNTLEYINGDLTAPSATTPLINCELPDTGSAHTLIVDIAVQLIARSLEDLSKIQITEDKITRTI
jgi:hypothetical protein